MRHEDEVSDKTKESFIKTPEKSHMKHTTRSYLRDPNLEHAAGDYEPIQEDSRFHASVDQERTAGKSSKERKSIQKIQNNNIVLRK